MNNQKEIPLTVIGMAALAGISVVAPCFGVAGIVIALFTSTVLIVIACSLVLGNPRPQIHHHFYPNPQPERRPHTEGHERTALLPNGAQFQERIVRRYDQ